MNFLRRYHRQTLLVLLGWLLAVAPTAAQQEQPEPQEPPERLVDRPPFDRITLTEAAGSAVVEVSPIPFENRQLPADPPPGERLRVNPLLRPNLTYEVAWMHIARIELYEQTLAVEARRLRDAGQYDDAYDYYAALQRDYPHTPNLEQDVQRYLFLCASASFKGGDLDDALAVLDELYRRNSEYSGLDRALASVGQQLLRKLVDGGDYRDAQGLIERLAKYQGALPEDRIALWRGQLDGIAEKQLTRARTEWEAGHPRQAHTICRAVLHDWPTMASAKELSAELLQSYPRVVVGVTQPVVETASDPLDNWAVRRTAPLLLRPLVAQTGFDPVGAVYASPLGAFSVGDDRAELRWTLSQQNNAITGYDVSRRLLEIADPTSDVFVPAWREMMANVAVDDVFVVRAELRGPFLRSEALLRVPIAAAGGPFAVDTQTADETMFLATADATDGALREVAELRFDDTLDAMRALRRGEIDLIDRIFPAEAATLEDDQRIRLRRFAVPTVHVLLPNYRRTYPANRTFRRALVYGIDREAILQQELLGGKSLEGCRVLSGPFPLGIASGDALSYAYDDTIAPRPYSPHLAANLVLVAERQAAKAAEKAGQTATKRAPLLLVHPADEIAGVAASAIASYLTAVGVACQAEPLPPGQTRPAADQTWDLLYSQLAMEEPIVDARRLLGVDGLARCESPLVNMALRSVQRTTNWKDARSRLIELHRTAHDEVAVVPLWQLTEHFAVRRGVTGVSEAPIRLYDDIDRWRIAPQDAP